MSLVNPLGFIKKARDKRVAIAAFNIYNLETIQAVLEGAEGTSYNSDNSRDFKVCRNILCYSDNKGGCSGIRYSYSSTS